MNGVVDQRWEGDYGFVLRTLLLKDFKVRYRNMSLGVGWSLANPLVMMGVLTFVFTKIFPNHGEKNFPVFVLCGLIPFNFFTLAWASATTSLVDNAGLIKRTRFPREIVPITTVLGNVLHYLIQLGMLLSLTLAFGEGLNRHWVWLPVVIALEVLFAVGMGLAFSAINVYVRDARYVVESVNVVLFWLVPVFYSFTIIPPEYKEVYSFNPLAAVVMAFRNILIENKAPAMSILLKLTLVSTLALFAGSVIFERLKKRFYDYL
ncbi:MAG: ABC transporter permease [Acidobacteria bacterium]|nr:ABC transporter permease [Acidobacteriota bacterium]